MLHVCSLSRDRKADVGLDFVFFLILCLRHSQSSFKAPRGILFQTQRCWKMFKEKTFVSSWLCFCCLVGVFGDTDRDTVKSVSVTEGDSVTLNTGLTEIQKADEMLWKFGPNRTLIDKINHDTGVLSTYDGSDGRFRDRLKLDIQTGSLTITNTRTTDSGVYEVSISNSSSQTKYRFNVTVYVSSSPPPDSVSLIVLISAAGSLLIVAAAGIFCIYKKFQTHTEEITYAEPKFYKRNTQKAICTRNPV
uniref:Immunoglobulin domain-containing protein n=1 Tax=Cyprinus carpio TaxID=7962 RepID=A0A8C2E2D7_CYPCA